MDDFTWIKQVRQIMNGYVQKTDGSYSEQKETSIGWNYKNCDRDLGMIQANQLKAQLNELFEHFPIEVIDNDCCIECVLKDVKQEKLIKTLIEQRSIYESDEQKQNLVDFIFYIGQGTKCEKVFRALNRLKSMTNHNHRMLLKLNYKNTQD